MGRHARAGTVQALPSPPAEGRSPLLRRIWRSIVPRGPVVPATDRDRAFVTIHMLLLHLRPVKVPAGTIRFTQDASQVTVS